ncbi:MAG: stage III sporulation protein AF [Clostridium sp.]|nr:stage III sporulation protein AF [Clostridium sp.]MCM1399431.1 stage III sporulation protein AF [Clostridium sp.]MCM1459985.1 stage III sporulation protein AF [Bacteroides sp.]
MLYGWMKSLIIYLIISGMVLNLTPSGNYKKYISFFTGLLVIIILAKPLTMIFKFSVGDLEKITYNMEHYFESNKILSDSDDMYDYYDMGVRDSIRLSVEELGYQVLDVSVTMDKDKNILSVKIILNENGGNVDEVQIKNHLIDVYYLEKDSINIVKR